MRLRRTCAYPNLSRWLTRDTAHYRFIVTFRGRWRSRLKNPQTEQIEPCPTVATALDQLEPIDIALNGP